MKNALIFTLTLLSTTLSAQFVKDKPLSEIDSKYIRLFSVIGGNGSVNARIDYGQNATSKESRIIDERGERYNFNSRAHVFNMLYDYGYEIKEILMIGENLPESNVVYILERI